MTNYEYLIKTGKLEAFIWDLLDTTTTIQSLNAQYGWELKSDRYNNRRIAEWLQTERKEPTKWVRLDEVLRAIGEPAVPLLPKDDKCIKFPDERELYERVNKIIDNRVKKIKELETREIEDKKICKGEQR